MRLPYSHKIRSTVRSLFESAMIRTGFMLEQPQLVMVQRDGVRQKTPGITFTREEMNQILHEAFGRTFDIPMKNTVYHLFVTRWANAKWAQHFWALRKSNLIHFSGLRHNINVRIPSVVGDKSESSDYIEINGDNILEWLLNTTRGSTYIQITTSKAPDNPFAPSIVSYVSLDIFDHRDAVAFKMVFG